MKPFLHTYPLPLHITHGDAGRLLLKRLPMENPLCSTKGVYWRRGNLFKTPSQAERRQRNIREVNLLDPQATLLPQFDLAHLNCVVGGPYQVRLANGYITSTQEQSVNQQYGQAGIWWNSFNQHHADCQQVNNQYFSFLLLYLQH